MRTPWGYDVDQLPPIMDEAEFNVRTGNAYASDPRVQSALYAASQAIRNHCGWHICPAIECDTHPVGNGKVLRLPAGYVSAISVVTEDGAVLTDDRYEWRDDGLIRKACGVWPRKWNSIEVTYTAGYDLEAVPDLAEAVCAIAAGVLAVAPGVTSESADGVSISYSASASSIAAGMTYQQKSALGAYKVVSSHGA